MTTKIEYPGKDEIILWLSGRGIINILQTKKPSVNKSGWLSKCYRTL